MASRHEAHNRAFWDADADDYQHAHGKQLGSERAPAWGAWDVPEAELGVLGDVSGLDVLELGCGAAQWSIRLRAAGAHMTGLDLSINQLRHAHGAVPLVLSSGETTPFANASFDVVFCDHGAMSFCEPRIIVPEVARLLRPGGLLAFNISSFLKWLTDKEDGSTKKLRRDWFGEHYIAWPDGVAEFQLPYGEWLALFREHGFEVEALIHLRPPTGAKTTYTEFVDYEWARRWPAEEIWKVRKFG
ncbi:MAG: methyltransferase domain-containing protein [Acidimicrobiia bacterium]